MKKIIKLLSSVKITVVCLFLLFVLTFWGTVAQVEHGLYAAQERYFFSFFFRIFGVVPFPGAQLVLWVLCFNLVASVIMHFSRLRHWRYAGLKLSHAGILVYFVAAFVILHGAVESNVHLMEGEGTNLSASYHEWELAYWKEGPGAKERQVTAYNVTQARAEDVLSAGDIPIEVKQFYGNSTAFKTQATSFRNDSGIGLLESKAMVKEREKNIAGGIFRIGDAYVLLYGNEARPTKIGDHYFALRRARYPLPFIIRLKEFTAEFHPGTKVAKSFESMVEVIKPNAKRDVRIYMNNPLREKDYTFYQASYDIDTMGREYSTLAVVKNRGQFLPYAACFMVFFGLALHFSIAALTRKQV